MTLALTAITSDLGASGLYVLFIPVMVSHLC
jgi:hypothetical protein